MHDSLDHDLAQLRERIHERTRLQDKLTAARAELAKANRQRQKLRTELEKEGTDVAELERMSFTNLIVSLFGDKDRRLDKEKKELAQAQLRYEEHMTHVEALRDEVAELQAAADALPADLDDQFAELCARKEKAILQSAGASGRQLQAVAEQRSALAAELADIDGARSGTEHALAALESLKRELDGARGWGMVDMAGGGLLTTALKHGRLSAAKTAAGRAQRAMSRLRRELQDVEARVPRLKVDVGGLMQASDYVFDGLLFDWIVQSKIGKAREEVDLARRQVRSVGTRLTTRHREATVQLEQLDRQRDALLGLD